MRADNCIILDNKKVHQSVENWFDYYLHKIDCQKQLNATKGYLNNLMLKHLETIPFAMLDYFVGFSPTVAPHAIIQKIVYGHRGGGCSQQNGLFSMALKRLGFDVEYGMARIPRKNDLLTPRCHMFLFVHIEGETGSVMLATA